MGFLVPRPGIEYRPLAVRVWSPNHWMPGNSPRLFFKKIIYLIYFWLHWVYIAALRLSLVAASGVYSFFVVRGLLIAAASVVVEHGL